MKRFNFIISIFSLILLARFSSAQPLSIQWAKCFGGSYYEKAYSTHQTRDGGYIMAGETESNDSDVSGNHNNSQGSDCWIVKTDSLGILQWQRCLGGSGQDLAYSIIE